jgi:hypothetical protein
MPATGSRKRRRRTNMDTVLFVNELVELLEETFERSSGHYLYRNTSLMESISALTAADASKRSSANGESVAAHVNHMRFFLDVLRDYITGANREPADWDSSWTLVEVDDAGWRRLVAELKRAYADVVELARSYDGTEEAIYLGGMMSILAHSAFHLAAVRQIIDGSRPASGEPSGGRSKPLE